MISEIKEQLLKLKGKRVKLLVDVGRNKLETYYGIIENIYDNIWTFKTEIDLKSFSYKDILINNVEISS